MIVNVEQFPYDWFRQLPTQSRRPGNQASRQKYYYKDIITAFDIETTRIKEIEQSVMYIWQWQFGPNYTVVGRTWYDFNCFVHDICKLMKANERLFVAVHNLSYEFQFLAGIYPFDPEEVFATDHRKVLKCSMYDKLDFKCSYMHSNMSLDKYLKAVGVEHQKLSGYDYTKERYWFTDLDPDEIKYCVHDVQGLEEAIRKEMEKDGDNLYTWPLTSTGYVRRDAKAALHECRHTLVKDILPDMRIYQLCREEFRGGNTHANRYIVTDKDMQIILEDCKGADRSSAYPYEICNSPVPMSRFFYVQKIQPEDLDCWIWKRGRAVIFRCRLYNLRLKDPYWPVPYISKSKCRLVHPDSVIDNGRVLSSPSLELTINDIDFKIILDEYDFDIELLDGAHARYGTMPDPFRELTIDYYRRKTALKGVTDDPDAAYYYGKAKAKLNALYGLCAQDPVKYDIEFLHGSFRNAIYDELEGLSENEWNDRIRESEEKILEENNRHAALAYQWGCWITAWARYHLEAGISAAHDQGEFLYCDTDSIKYRGSVSFDEINKEAKDASIKSGSWAEDRNGKRHYMGIYEDEGTMARFMTLGAKKYAYEDEAGELHITIAGVNKKLGAEELKEAGGLEALNEGFIFRKAGGVELVYNDFPAQKRYRTDQGEIYITRNVVIRETTKTLSLTDEYADLLQNCRRNRLDIGDIIH